MTESIYRVTEVIGTSPTSWEEAAKNAVGDRREDPPRSPRRRGRAVGRHDRGRQGEQRTAPAWNISFKYESS